MKKATYDNSLSEMIVDEFYDLITKAEQPVKHAAIRPQGRTHEWQWQLAGTYTIANSRQTVAMATNGLRLARFTTSPPPGINNSEMKGFLPYHYKKSRENKSFYDLFDQILTEWSVVVNDTFYFREDLINLCKAETPNGVAITILGLTVPITYILDFCNATQENIISCLIVTNASGTSDARLKLIAGQLEEILIPIPLIGKKKR